jgi:lipopolysaccharide biosynthesis protein
MWLLKGRARRAGQLLLGREQRRRWWRRDWAIEVPFRYELPLAETDVAGTAFKLAAVCHLFHPEVTAEMIATLRNIEGPVDLYLSTDTEQKRLEILAAIGEWSAGSVEVRVLENRGRDIAPKLVGFAGVYGRYDVVLLLHSKKDTHKQSGGAWRSYLFKNLAGSPQTVRSVLEIFQQQPRVGAVMAQHIAGMREWIRWVEDFEPARRLALRMGFKVRPERAIDFPSGSMFWVRTAALRPLLDLQLRNAVFAEEPAQACGTTAHAIERLFLFAVEQAGYVWVKIADPSTAVARGRIFTVRSRGDLARFVKRHGFSLLKRHGNHRGKTTGSTEVKDGRT